MFEVKKSEMKTAPNNKLIVDLVETYADFYWNYNCGASTIRIEKHWNDLDEELVKRGLLTKDDVKRMHS